MVPHRAGAEVGGPSSEGRQRVGRVSAVDSGVRCGPQNLDRTRPGRGGLARSTGRGLPRIQHRLITDLGPSAHLDAYRRLAQERRHILGGQHVHITGP